MQFESLPLKESASIKLPQLYANLDWNAKGGGGFRVVDLEKLGRGERQFGEEWEGRRFLEALGGEGTIEAEKEIRLVGM